MSTDAINAYYLKYEQELNARAISFADDVEHLFPSDMAAVEVAVFASRDDGPGPSKAEARLFRNRVRSCLNEAAIVEKVLPKIVPMDDLMDDPTTCTLEICPPSPAFVTSSSYIKE